METGTGLVRALIAAVEVCFTHLIMFIEESKTSSANYSRTQSTIFSAIYIRTHSKIFNFAFYC